MTATPPPTQTNTAARRGLLLRDVLSDFEQEDPADDASDDEECDNEQHEEEEKLWQSSAVVPAAATTTTLPLSSCFARHYQDSRWSTTSFASTPQLSTTTSTTTTRNSQAKYCRASKASPSSLNKNFSSDILPKVPKRTLSPREVRDERQGSYSSITNLTSSQQRLRGANASWQNNDTVSENVISTIGTIDSAIELLMKGGGSKAMDLATASCTSATTTTTTTNASTPCMMARPTSTTHTSSAVFQNMKMTMQQQPLNNPTHSLRKAANSKNKTSSLLKALGSMAPTSPASISQQQQPILPQPTTPTAFMRKSTSSESFRRSYDHHHANKSHYHQRQTLRLVPSKAHTPPSSKSDRKRSLRSRLSYSKSAGNLGNLKNELSAIMEDDNCTVISKRSCHSEGGACGLQREHLSFEDFKKARRDGYKLRKRISADFKSKRRSRSSSLDLPASANNKQDQSTDNSDSKSNARWVTTTTSSKNRALSSPMPSTLRPNVRADCHSTNMLMAKFDKWDCQGSPIKKTRNASCDQLLKQPTRSRYQNGCENNIEVATNKCNTKSRSLSPDMRRVTKAAQRQPDVVQQFHKSFPVPRRQTNTTTRKNGTHGMKKYSRTSPNHKIKSVRAALGPMTPGITSPVTSARTKN